MVYLSDRTEQLLKEILEHRLDSGMCDSNYWAERFESLSDADDVVIRSCFKQLKDAEMIAVQWEDNYPYYMVVLEGGLSYFQEKEKQENNSFNSIVIYGDARNTQIQQGTTNSYQSQSISEPIDELKIKQLIEEIEKYNTQLDKEIGNENMDKLLQSINELKDIENNKGSDKRKRQILLFMRDLLANAGGNILSAGIIALITNLLG